MNNSTCKTHCLAGISVQLTPFINFPKWPIIGKYFVGFSNSWVALFYPSFSLSQLPTIFQLSFFSSGLKPPPNSSIYCLSGRITGLLHTCSCFQHVCEFVYHINETYSKNPSVHCYSGHLICWVFYLFICVFVLLNRWQDFNNNLFEAFPKWQNVFRLFLISV